MTIRKCKRIFLLIASVAMLATAAQPAAADASSNGWQLTWSDEFNGTTLDGSKWLNPTMDNQCDGNFQHTTKADDAYLDGSGNLVIRAQSRASGGCGPMNLTAGQISTKGRFSQAYGKFEFRAQMPAGGPGVWPSMWLYPIGVSWPPEIDVLQSVSDMSTAYMTYHWAQNGLQYSLSSTTNPGLAAGFHTYAVEWDPGTIRWFIDGIEARPAVTGSIVADVPMGIIIDMYLGGWAGGVNATFPQYMYVDYVRVYSRQNVSVPLAITTAQQLPDGMVGSAYSTTLAASGGTTPYRWQVSSGALPAGLSLNQTTGVISGTPTGAINTSLSISVTDANAASLSATFSLQVAPAQIAPVPLAIATAPQLPDGRVGSAYSTTLAATGGTTPYRWQVTSGSLPGGLSLNQTTGVISGTPTGAISTSLSITVTDTNAASLSATFSLQVAPAPLVITTAPQLPDGRVGSAYSATLAATGGTTPYRWQLSSGSLPAGLSLNQTTGVISGTPTSAVTAIPSITVTDANAASLSAAFSLQVTPAPLAITTAQQLPDGRVGSAYSTTLAASGGTTPYRWQVASGALPAGLSLNQTTGVISGTPTSAVTAIPSITVTDANAASASAAFSLRVISTLAITAAPQLPDGTVGSAYSTTLAASGGTTPYRWQVISGSLPAGLSLNQTTGVISGTPTSAINTSMSITVTDANAASVSAGFSIRIVSAPLAITTASRLTDGSVGTAYSTALAASGGTTPYRWQVISGSLPAGLSLNQTTGVISGTPTGAINTSMSIAVTDANAASTNANFSLTVVALSNGWRLTWSDEFNGTTLDGSKWRNPHLDNQCDGNFQQTTKADDAYLDGIGNLVIRAQSRASGGCGPMNLTAGQISTKGHFSQAYGKFEFRAQMPAGGPGIWPALWLYPIGVAWPPEIDVVETISDMSTAYMTYHWADNGHQYSLASTSNPSLATGFHTYAVEWEPGVIRWLIDGVEARPPVTGSIVSNMPMGIIIDIYLGGWAGGVNATFPQYMYVDYVRVYTRP